MTERLTEEGAAPGCSYRGCEIIPVDTRGKHTGYVAHRDGGKIGSGFATVDAAKRWIDLKFEQGRFDEPNSDRPQGHSPEYGAKVRGATP